MPLFNIYRNSPGLSGEIRNLTRENLYQKIQKIEFLFSSSRENRALLNHLNVRLCRLSLQHRTFFLPTLLFSRNVENDRDCHIQLALTFANYSFVLLDRVKLLSTFLTIANMPQFPDFYLQL